ncbi:MAG: hypothetical protein E6343_16740 [Clostridium perfringens]|nr:hypothetical protein [Clostridium perfringens]
MSKLEMCSECHKYKSNLNDEGICAECEGTLRNECEGHIEKDHLKQAIDNLIDELEFAIMQYPEQRDYLINGTLEIIESEFKDNE